MSEKLQKVLARAGLGSRREVEAWIEAGRVSVDGARVGLGARVTGEEAIRIDGRLVSRHRLAGGSRRRVLLYNKPEGEVCSRADAQARATVFDRLPRLDHGRWLSVGRLDVNSMGLLLLTTDGELAHRLTHPSFELEREYAVRVLGEVSPEQLQALLVGVELEDGPARFERLQEAGGEGANHWYHVVLKEGRKREVRRLWEALGLQASRLIRLRYGTMILPRNLPRGRWWELDEKQTEQLAASVGLTTQKPDLPAGPKAEDKKRRSRPRPPHRKEVRARRSPTPTGKRRH